MSRFKRLKYFFGLFIPERDNRRSLGFCERLSAVLGSLSELDFDLRYILAQDPDDIRSVFLDRVEEDPVIGPEEEELVVVLQKLMYSPVLSLRENEEAKRVFEIVRKMVSLEALVDSNSLRLFRLGEDPVSLFFLWVFLGVSFRGSLRCLRVPDLPDVKSFVFVPSSDPLVLCEVRIGIPKEPLPLARSFLPAILTISGKAVARSLVAIKLGRLLRYFTDSARFHFSLNWAGG